MIRTTAVTFVVTIGVVATATSSCGKIVERATEEAVERAVENDGGDEVDVDFSDGEIRVETDDGEITFNADQDGVQIDGTDADGNDFTLDADENGINANSEGGASLDVDEAGNFEATDDNGEVFTGGADENGDFTIEGDNGESIFNFSEGVPEQWPDDVPVPEGLDQVNGTYTSDSESVVISLLGEVSGNGQEIYDNYIPELEDAGFEEESVFKQDGAISSTHVRGEQRLSILLGVDDSFAVTLM